MTVFLPAVAVFTASLGIGVLYVNSDYLIKRSAVAAMFGRAMIAAGVCAMFLYARS